MVARPTIVSSGSLEGNSRPAKEIVARSTIVSRIRFSRVLVVQGPQACLPAHARPFSYVFTRRVSSSRGTESRPWLLRNAVYLRLQAGAASYVPGPEVEGPEADTLVARQLRARTQGGSN